MGIAQWCAELTALPGEVWLRYRLTREPLRGKLSREDYAVLYRAAEECGSALAGKLRQKYGDVPPEELAVLRQVLAQDPRPSYQEDATRVYGMPYGCHDVRFRVVGDILTVVEVKEQSARIG